MKCPECGHDMGKRSKCLRCGYTVKSVISIDPEKIEQEKTTKEEQSVRKEIHPDDVHVSRAGGSIFGDIFGGGIFGGFGSIIDSIFGGFDIFGSDNSRGYEYDPKYYDDFGNEIYLPDEFERESVEIADVELLEDMPKREKQERREESPRREESQRREETRREEPRRQKEAGERPRKNQNRGDGQSPYARFKKAFAEKKRKRRPEDKR